MMKLMILLFLIGPQVFAGGVMSLTGQFMSCESTVCKVKVDQVQVYKINIKKLSLMQRHELKSKKNGDHVAMSVVMSSIEAVEDFKK